MEIAGDKLFSKIHELAVGQLECGLTPGQELELQSLLLESSAARRAYVEYVQESACLRWLCLEELSGAIEPAKPARDEVHRGGRRRRIEYWMLVGGVACLLGAVTLGWLSSRQRSPAIATYGELSNVAAVAPANDARKSYEKYPSVGDSPADVPELVATITGLRSAHWLSATEGGRLLSRCRVGEHLQLQHGAAELTFDAGAQVTVFGPADFEITSPTSIRCSRGRITTLVDKRGKGFTIHTPQAKVVDLGTQFGLAISDDGATEVVVFQGSVDMSYSPPAATRRVSTRRLRQGEALLLKNSGEFQRVVSVERNSFLSAADNIRRRRSDPVILDVEDNIRKAESLKSYQIVHAGLEEDAVSFVDRNHQWNGLDAAGLPAFLEGADYIMPFNDDKFVRNLELTVRIARPSTLYVFLDNNMEVPGWLRDNFTDTQTDIGLDCAKTQWHRDHTLGDGAGGSIDFSFSVWRRDVKQSGTVTLGSVNPPKIGTRSYGFNMYGIAAVAAD